MVKKFVADPPRFATGYSVVRARVFVAALILMRAHSYAIGSRFLAKMLTQFPHLRDFCSGAEGTRMVDNGP